MGRCALLRPKRCQQAGDEADGWRGIAGSPRGAGRPGVAGGGLGVAVTRPCVLPVDDLGPAVQPRRRLAAPLRPRAARRFPRGRGPAHLLADGYRLLFLRAFAVRDHRGLDHRSSGDAGRRLLRGMATPAAAGRRAVRRLLLPDRPDAGQCWRSAECLFLRHDLQPLLLERALHPGADPVPAAAQRPPRRYCGHRDCGRAPAGDVLPQALLLRRGPRRRAARPPGLPACPRPLARLDRDGRPGHHQCHSALQPCLPA